MQKLKKLCDVVETTMVIIAFLAVIFMLPMFIRDEEFFLGILSVSVFFFFWEHFFWHKILRLSDCIGHIYFTIRRLRGKNKKCFK